MEAIRITRALGANDARNVRRDPLLRWILLYPVMIALASRWALPPIIARAERYVAVDLGSLYPAIIGYALLITTPILCGTVVGFLLLDERDDRTLLAIRVTPVPPGLYLGYRLAAPMLAGLAMTVVGFLLAGLDRPGLGEVALAAVAAAPLAPLTGLALAVFAANKVQGFALLKASGIVTITPVIARFVDAPWTAVFGISPAYWPAKLLWMLEESASGAWVYLVVGVAYEVLLLVLLLRRFGRVTGA